MFLFKGEKNWVMGSTYDSVCPAGCFRLEPSFGRESITIRSIFDGKAFIFNKPVSEILKPDGSGYADFNELKSATIEFFCSNEPYPNLLTIPDKIDFATEGVVYQGYKRGTSYLILRRYTTETTIDNTWACGNWDSKEDLFIP